MKKGKALLEFVVDLCVFGGLDIEGVVINFTSCSCSQ